MQVRATPVPYASMSGEMSSGPSALPTEGKKTNAEAIDALIDTCAFEARTRRWLVVVVQGLGCGYMRLRVRVARGAHLLEPERAREVVRE